MGIPQHTKAFLIVGGSKIYRLDHEVVNIGRKLGNELVINDPRVSRNHAQIRFINENFVLFDMESSGGCFVNGTRSQQAILHPGDVISLAGVPMVFGQDASRTSNQVDQYEQPDDTNEGATQSMQLSDLDLDDFSSNEE